MLPAGANTLDLRLVVPALEANYPGIGGRRRINQQQQARMQEDVKRQAEGMNVQQHSVKTNPRLNHSC